MHERALANRIRARAGVAPPFRGVEGAAALLANVDAVQTLMPYDALPLDSLFTWAVQWMRPNGRLVGKPSDCVVRVPRVRAQ